MNPNYAKEVKEDIDKLLQAGFIYLIDNVTWLILIVLVPKKNGSLRVCVDYMKLNVEMNNEPFPIPFCESILDVVVGHELVMRCTYSYMVLVDTNMS